MRMEAICKSENHAEECPTCGGEVRRRTFGEVYGGTFILDGQRLEIRNFAPEGFSDPIVLEQITQYFDGGLYRLWPGEDYFARGGKRLHRAVWSAFHGPIPSGCHIHHRKAGDTSRNGIENLEC